MRDKPPLVSHSKHAGELRQPELGPHERVHATFGAIEWEWRRTQQLSANLYKSFAAAEAAGIWVKTLADMRGAVRDATFLRLSVLMEEAVKLAIDTNHAGSAGLSTLHEMLAFGRGVGMFRDPDALFEIKRARNEYLHTESSEVPPEADPDAVLDALAAELEHLGFGPVPRLRSFMGDGQPQEDMPRELKIYL